MHVSLQSGSACGCSIFMIYLMHSQFSYGCQSSKWISFGLFNLHDLSFGGCLLSRPRSVLLLFALRHIMNIHEADKAAGGEAAPRPPPYPPWPVQLEFDVYFDPSTQSQWLHARHDSRDSMFASAMESLGWELYLLDNNELLFYHRERQQWFSAPGALDLTGMLIRRIWNV